MAAAAPKNRDTRRKEASISRTANHVRGEVILKVGGQELVAVLGLAALAKTEKLLGVKTLQEIGPALQKQLSAATIVSLVVALLNDGGSDMTDEDFLAARPGLPLSRALSAIGECFAAINPEGEKGKSPGN